MGWGRRARRPESGRLHEAGLAAARLPGEHDAAAAEVRPALAESWGDVCAALMAYLGGDLVDQHNCGGSDSCMSNHFEM